jgi:hypothetical protein
MADEPLDERKARALLEIHYRDLSTLSRGLEDGVQAVQRATGMLREHLPGGPLSEKITDILATLGESLGTNLAHVAKMQDRIRNEGLAPPDD